MNKFIVIIVLMVIACANAKPAIVSVAPAVAYNAPLVAAAAPAALPFVTATSSQVVSRNYNAAYVPSPAVFAAAPASYPYIASAAAPLTYSSPYSIAAAPVLL